MCIEVYARFSCCPHSHFLTWTYCSLITSNVPAAGRMCRKYKRKVRGCVSGRARECAECAMDRKIRDEFGDAVLESVTRCVGEEPRAKKRRFWRRGHERGEDQVPAFAHMPIDVEAWPAMEMMPVVLPEESEGEIGVERGHKMGRSRHDSASFRSRESLRSDDVSKDHASGVWDWIRCSFGGRG